MADVISTERRSANMRRIKSKNTKPEMLVRRLVHSLGYRYRLHRKDLPGKPDLVFGPKRKAIFVHGCFWHGHETEHCPDRRSVKSNVAYWSPKLAGNKMRDKRNLEALHQNGWDVLTIWECETRDSKELIQTLKSFLKR